MNTYKGFQLVALDQLPAIAAMGQEGDWIVLTLENGQTVIAKSTEINVNHSFSFSDGFKSIIDERLG